MSRAHLDSSPGPLPHRADHKRGAYIVIEGIDGSGKTTQFDRLLSHLGDRALGVREPGGTPMGERLRTLLKDKHVPRSPQTNVFMFAAARAELIESVIRPEIKAGKIVVSDRSWLSSLAAQSTEGVDAQRIWELNRLATREFFEPDLLILIDLDPEVCRQRTTGRGGADMDYFDSKASDYFERVRTAYLDGITQIRHGVVIDGNGPADEVWQRIKKQVMNRGIGA